MKNIDRMLTSDLFYLDSQFLKGFEGRPDHDKDSHLKERPY